MSSHTENGYASEMLFPLHVQRPFLLLLLLAYLLMLSCPLSTLRMSRAICKVQKNGLHFCSFALFLMAHTTLFTRNWINDRQNQVLRQLFSIFRKDAFALCQIGYGKVWKYAIKLLALEIFVLLIYLVVCDYSLAISICIVEIMYNEIIY